MPEIRSGREGAVATITISQPERRNAISTEMWVAFGAEVNAIARDESVRVLVVTGDGTDFCAGASRFAWGRLLWRDVWNVSVADGALSVAFCLLLSPTL